jgi:hypothetical protein
MNSGKRALQDLGLIALAAFALLGGLTAATTSQATPLYSAREGRTCDNCHLTPNNWENPPLAERKCTLSCGSCHVDPSGGGARNASGRFFGRSTLPMIATSPRPTDDWDREVVFFLSRLDRATTYTDSLPQGPNRYGDFVPEGPRDLWAIGSPLAGPSRMALLQGRYGRLNADPLFRLGWDIRVAGLLAGQGLVFPMQADLTGVFHPLEHLTAVATVGARGRTRGFTTVVDDPETPYLREGYLLLHEAPYLAYVKAGRFVPAFGLRLDDHTAQTRRTFGLDGSLPEIRVSGIEVGANPNYPFVSLAWFRSTAEDRVPSAFDITDFDAGHGFALNAGFREMAWSVGSSALLRRRPVTEGGDETSLAVYGVLNPWRTHRGLPLTWQVELDVGEWTRDSGSKARRAAFYQEFDYRLGNGVNLLLAQDWSDPDRAVENDDAYRVSTGIQITPIPGVTLDTRIRALLPMGDEGGADVFMQLHLWN